MNKIKKIKEFLEDDKDSFIETNGVLYDINQLNDETRRIMDYYDKQEPVFLSDDDRSFSEKIRDIS